MPQTRITVTLTVAELMLIPGDGIIRILGKADPPRDFLQACLDHEWRKDHGKGRWPVTNYLKTKLKS